MVVSMVDLELTFLVMSYRRSSSMDSPLTLGECYLERKMAAMICYLILDSSYLLGKLSCIVNAIGSSILTTI